MEKIFSTDINSIYSQRNNLEKKFIYLFDLHTHSNFSDGAANCEDYIKTLYETDNKYKAKGYKIGTVALNLLNNQR